MIRERNGSWFVRWREQGKQVQRHFGSGPDAKRKAELYDLDKKMAKKQGRPADEPQSGERKGQVWFDDLCQQYLDHIRACGRSEKYIRELKNTMNVFFIPAFSKRPVAELTYNEDVVPFANSMRYRDTEKKVERSMATRNRYLDHLNSIFNHARHSGLITNNPLAGWRKTKEPPRDVRLTVKDFQKIKAAAAPHLAWALEVAFALGVRCGESELLALDWSQVDFENAEIKVYGRKTKTFRVIPLTNTFLARLREMKAAAKTSKVIEYKGRSVRKLRRSFETACEKAGITYPIRMYDVRHLFASVMISKGADVAAVSKLLGHSNIKMTVDTYYHVLEGEKRRAIELLPEVM